MQRLVLIFLITIQITSVDVCEPYGLRIYYGEMVANLSSLQRLVIYFNTKESCGNSFISLNSSGSSMNVSCSSKALTGSALLINYVTYINICSISDIPFEQYFSYTAYGWNTTLSINPTPYQEQQISIKLIDPRVATRSLKMVVLADWGKIQTNIMTPITDYLKDFLKSTQVNAVMVAGDIAYALDTANGKYYQDFLVLMQDYSPRLPFFLSPGNHQRRTVDAALFFNQSFKVYNVDKKLATGIYFGSLFLTIFDPYNYVYGKTQSISCLDALKVELAKGKESKRFIIPYSHYALICSGEYAQCLYNYNRLKIYLDTMHDNGVRLYIGAHTHTYERTYPLYRNGSFIVDQTPYDAQQQQIISIVQGVSGNNKSIITTMPVVQSFTNKYTVNETGFGVLSSTSQSVIYQHYSTKQGFMDKVVIKLTSKSKSINYIALGAACAISAIIILTMIKLGVSKLVQPKPKVQIKSEKVDITELKDSVVLEEPKLSIQIQ